MVELLRAEVRRLVNFGASALTRGSVSSLMRRGAFVYSTRLWIEDGDGFELIVDQPLFADAAHVRDSDAPREAGAGVGGNSRFELDDGYRFGSFSFLNNIFIDFIFWNICLSF